MILLDMDGVLTDFTRQALPLFGHKPDWPIVTPNMEEALCITSKEFWDTIDEAGHEFWATMPETKECDSILKIVEETKEEWLISTSPSRSSDASKGKVMWMQKKFGDYFTSYMIGGKKYAMSRPGNILIDDFEKNCTKFITVSKSNPCPGRAILVARPWNHIGIYAPEISAVQSIKDGLELFL